MRARTSFEALVYEVLNENMFQLFNVQGCDRAVIFCKYTGVSMTERIVDNS